MVVIERYSKSITIYGHANYAEIGKDIVCDSVSTLVQTLMEL